jgi:hypothetical protein
VNGQQTAPYEQTLSLPAGTPVPMVLGGQTNQLPNPQGMSIELEFVSGASGSVMHAIGNVSNPYTPAHQEVQVPVVDTQTAC